MRRLSLVAGCLGATLAAAGTAAAGGQQIAVELAPDGRSILVRTYRCGTPSGFKITGRAEGVVDGRQRSLGLEITGTREPGVFAVARQWPEEGRWVLTFTAQGNAFVNALVELEPGARLRIASQESTLTKITPGRVSAALRRLSRS